MVRPSIIQYITGKNEVNMMSVKNIYRIGFLFCLTAVVVLTACSGDESASSSANRQLSLRFFAHQMDDVPIAQAPSRRALPTGFDPYTPAAGTNIIGFIAPETGTAVAAHIFTLDQNQWKTNITIEDPSANYYLYGFLPVGSDTSTDISTSRIAGKEYKDGAKILINRIKSLTTQDPCVIVGVKKASTGTASINNIDIQPGQFQYQFNAEPSNEYAYLLLDHVFGAYQYQIGVTESYSKLRTIKLKSVTLSTMGSKTVNAVVTLTANTTSPLTSVVCTPNNDTGSNTVTLYQTGANESDKLLTTNYQDLATCYAPPINQQLKLTAVYDVYDKSGNHLIRENCNAENIFTPIVQETDLKPGKRHTIRITVNPTYLYVLSDPDLDNPTITVN